MTTEEMKALRRVGIQAYDDANAVLAHLANLGDLFGQLMTVSDLTIEVFGDPSPDLHHVGASVGAGIYSFFQGLA